MKLKNLSVISLVLINNYKLEEHFIEKDKLTNPMNISFFGLVTIMPHTHHITNIIK